MRHRSILAALVPAFATSTGAAQPPLKPASSGYATSSEHLKVYYEIHGKGEPIVLMAGGFGDAAGYSQGGEPRVALLSD